ncbi:hypothetical protein LIER_39840 [Lithospermum erythrorhizon]|uniref:BSD2 cysteine rich domain-containing protein n=1 Tax=Lithospermum erythrorhizon TaxID=34254 RepID=A0AAV3QP02_LITER
MTSFHSHLHSEVCCFNFGKFSYIYMQASSNDQDTATKRSILCGQCEGNGVVQCKQCEGSGVNSVDHFNGRFKAGGLCWLCRGKKDILCGNCNGAGFMGGFMSSMDD